MFSTTVFAGLNDIFFTRPGDDSSANRVMDQDPDWLIKGYV